MTPGSQVACTPTWLAHKHCASLTFYFCLQCPFPPPHVRPEASSRDLPPGATVCVCVCVACFLVTEAPGQGWCPHPQGLPCPDCRVTGNVRVDSFLLPCRITLNFPKQTLHTPHLCYTAFPAQKAPPPPSPSLLKFSPILRHYSPPSPRSRLSTTHLYASRGYAPGGAGSHGLPPPPSPPRPGSSSTQASACRWRTAELARGPGSLTTGSLTIVG